MEPKSNIITDFLQRYAIWLVGIALTITTMWLNSQYVSIQEFDKLQSEFDQFKSEYNARETSIELKQAQLEEDITILKSRLSKKIDVQNEMLKELNLIENQVIRHDEKLKNIK